MQSSAPHTTQLFPPFGGGFVHEEANAPRSYFAMSDRKGVPSSVTTSMLADIMSSLRSMLSLRYSTLSFFLPGSAEPLREKGGGFFFFKIGVWLTHFALAA